ncbi:predicted protein [Nematostella vectensis]|uniref:Uncharacterized protein n=1 Tax=Nematostella vectensis TaxID=45351 RepID=A7RG62_NEMVE|nr:predicted protein [Nematostella vectensis]|eukprot:XP_001641428.1 predicted protein [Nematostella vectensis]
MDERHKNVLRSLIPELSHGIQDPYMITGFMSNIFTESDCSEIRSSQTQSGPIRASEELVLKLMKRGKNAFNSFLTTLRNPKIGHKDLAQLIESRLDDGLQGHTGREVISRGPSSVSEASSSRAETTPPNRADEAEYPEVPPPISQRQRCPFSKETLLKNIPSSLRDTIVQTLNIKTELGNNWRGVAGHMGLTSEEVDRLDDSGKMDSLFAQMVHKNYKLQDIVDLLKECERHDVVESIESHPGYEDVQRARTKENGNMLQEQTGTESKGSLAFPRQESCKSEVEKTDEPDVRYFPSEDSNPPDEDITSETPEEMNLDENDVFSVYQRSCLLVECLNYEKLSGLTDIGKGINSLSDCLSHWEGDHIRIRNCKSAKLNSKVNQFVKDCGHDVCFVYLAGHTVQLNGENYLLPTDIKPDCTQADLIQQSLNINKLILQLHMSPLLIVIVDGSHHIEGKFRCPGILPGLSAIPPPPNGVIAFPCHPGSVRDPEHRRSYVSSMADILSENPDIELSELFKKIKEVPELYSKTDIVGLNAKPTETTSWHAIIFVNGKNNRYKNATHDSLHLEVALKKLGWNDVSTHCDRRSVEICEILRKKLRALSGKPRKVVMVYYVGAACQMGEDNVLGLVDHENPPYTDVSTQWLINLMSEYISGPKILIVDDLQTSESGLYEHVAPLEFLISLPKKRRSNIKSEDQSYTLLLSQMLGVNLGQSLKNIVQRASRAQHHVSNNLFYA